MNILDILISTYNAHPKISDTTRASQKKPRLWAQKATIYGVGDVKIVGHSNKWVSGVTFSLFFCLVLCPTGEGEGGLVVAHHRVRDKSTNYSINIKNSCHLYQFCNRNTTLANKKISRSALKGGPGVSPQTKNNCHFPHFFNILYVK